MRSRTLLLAALVAVAASRASMATAARPQVALAAGTTTAIEGRSGDAGPSLSAALLWPIEDHFRIGVMGIADDLGEQDARLIGPGDVDLGPVAGAHRATMAAVWRMEAHLPTAGRWDPFLATTWGAYRVREDLRGASTSSFAAAGFGLGVGLARGIGDVQTLGILARYQQLSRGQAQRYLSAAVEWRWRGSASE